MALKASMIANNFIKNFNKTSKASMLGRFVGSAMISNLVFSMSEFKNEMKYTENYKPKTGKVVAFTGCYLTAAVLLIVQQYSMIFIPLSAGIAVGILAVDYPATNYVHYILEHYEKEYFGNAESKKF